MSDAAAAAFAFEKQKRMPIVDRDTEDLMHLLNANNYQKGAWVLHMLRSSMGDEVFFRAIRDYYQAHLSKTANSEDLRAALEKSSGRNLRTFFARWIYDSGHPQYELSWQWLRKRELRLELRQVQAGNAFLDPLPIVLRTDSGAREIVLKPVGKTTVQTIQLREKPSGIEVDPRNTLLKEARLRNPY